jgi:hypothetical protein
VRSTTSHLPFIETRTWIKHPLHDVHGPSCYGSADHDTRHAAVQRKSGIGAAETEESVTLGKTRKRKDRTVSGASHRTASPWAQWVRESSNIMRAWKGQRYEHVAMCNGMVRTRSCLVPLKLQTGIVSPEGYIDPAVRPGQTDCGLRWWSGDQDLFGKRSCSATYNYEMC